MDFLVGLMLRQQPFSRRSTPRFNSTAADLFSVRKAVVVEANLQLPAVSGTQGRMAAAAFARSTDRRRRELLLAATAGILRANRTLRSL
jgi:hypothetical protein